MADDRVGYEALRPLIDSHVALIQGVLRFNVAMMQAWLGAGAPATEDDTTEDERPSEAAKNPEYMTP